MDGVNYKEYEIYPDPMIDSDTGKWKPSIEIMRPSLGKGKVRDFSAKGTFVSKEEAAKAGIEFGKRIIDGQIPGCTVDDL